MSKGSSPRPFEIDHKTFSDNFEAIFGKKNKEQKPEKKLPQNCGTGYCSCIECLKEKK